MNYSGYNPNQQQPQQQQQHSYYEYDPSQIQVQPYDHSYAAAYQSSYYAYNPQYAYYPADTTQVQQPHLHYQPEPAPVHPPGVNPEPVQPTFNHLPVNSIAFVIILLFYFWNFFTRYFCNLEGNFLT